MFSLTRRWREPCGYKDVLNVSLPLVMSMGSVTLMQFTDRLFLGHYSLESIAAATPAGILSLLFLSLFLGTGEYAGVFIAQYTGMGKPERVGNSLWQGIWFALGSGVVLALCSLLSTPLFTLINHPPAVQQLEITYFRILMLGNVFMVLQAVFGCFYSGRGITRPVMLVNFLGTCVNIPLDYAMINGLRIGGVTLMPEMGITGAALATVISWAVMALGFYIPLFSKKNETLFRIRSGYRLDKELFGRLMRYGVPGGVHFLLDIFAVSFFVFMVGRLGTNALAATNIVFSLNSIAFMPMLGFSIGISILVGQALGADNPQAAHRTTMSTLHMTLFYMGLMGLVYILFPYPLVHLFQPRDMPDAEYAAIVSDAVLLLRLVALYSLFDALVMVFYGALKGAGDTRFVMWLMGFLSVCVAAAPVYLAVEVFHCGLFSVWLLFTLYILALSSSLYLRYRNGSWRNMRVVGDWERKLSQAATS